MRGLDEEMLQDIGIPLMEDERSDAGHPACPSQGMQCSSLQGPELRASISAKMMSMPE